MVIEASLKASQMASNINLMVNSVEFVATRVDIQQALQNYNENRNNTPENWVGSIPDMQAAVGGQAASGGAVGQALLLQSMIFPKNASGPAGPYSVLNTTGDNILGHVKLPYQYPNGTDVYLGDADLGYPSNLYPNFTYTDLEVDGVQEAGAMYNGDVMSPSSSEANNVLVLGPWPLNSTFALMSITIPMINNTSASDVLGWLTVVVDARLLSSVINSRQGLDQTGQMLVIAPMNDTNQYPPNVVYDDSPSQSVIAQQHVQFVLPLAGNESDRHPNQTYGSSNPSFLLSQYPAALAAVTKNQNAVNNAGSQLSATNEAGKQVSTGFAMIDVPFINWVVVVEELRSEVWAPINQLRKVLLACIFGTIGALCLLVWPIAHFASKPIRELRAATLKSVQPPGYVDSRGSYEDIMSMVNDGNESDSPERDAAMDVSASQAMARKEGFFGKVTHWRSRKRKTKADREEEARRREFRIPGKVKDRKHLVKDELSDLTKTFNEMSDELMMQYERLEERVRLRTAELEMSKKAAEAANESKTLFIANISHELKTPLNGILGMCAVCMQEDDPIRLKRSLGIIYKSGDLLLNLLTDLLTFSKNQVGQQLSLDEKEFRLRDVSSQIHAIFEKQAKEGQIDLVIRFQGGSEDENDETFGNVAGERSSYMPLAGGRVKDMVLWGDTHRILQVVINLVSNSLKFTPAGGKVTLTVRCIGEAPDIGSRKSSFGSKASKKVSGRQRHSDASLAHNSRTLSADGEKGGAFARVMEMERSTPPPGRPLLFEFEVVDTGPGIPENLHQRIFEPFVQGDLGLSKKYGGTGLGLSICSQLAGLMQGGMSLQSEVGKGSKFSMRIPLRLLFTRADSTASSSVNVSSEANGIPGTPDRGLRGDEPTTNIDSTPIAGSSSPNPNSERPFVERQPRLVGLSQPFFASTEPMESPGSQPSAMEQITATAQESGRIRVLVAEDNKVNQEVVLRMLKLEDIYDVTVAKDGQEALDLVKESMGTPEDNPGSQLAGKGPFNLIFMDVQMPNLDGLQSTKLIREIGYDAPIVALTAFAEESNVRDCLDSGMNYFLSKPIRRPALKKVLKEYCAPILEEDESVSPATVVPEKKARKASAATVEKKEKPLPAQSVVDETKRTSADIRRNSADVGGRRGSGVDIATGSPNTTFVVISRPTSGSGEGVSFGSPVKRPPLQHSSEAS